jgi:hypothetical protein
VNSFYSRSKRIVLTLLMVGVACHTSGLAQAAQCAEKVFVGDFNGDGLADVIRWRDSDKKWVVYLSTGHNFVTQTWGGAWGSDGPIFVGDLNGDGKTDVFMWRDADKSWTVNLSTGTAFAPQLWHGDWGSDGPINVGDLNADGKADVFMWRGDTWTVNLSTGSNWAPAMWNGLPATECVLVGDFNGDHRTDVLMYHPASDNFSVNLSTGSGWIAETWPHPPQLPRYNEVAFKATHNSYWVKRDNVVEAFASGTQERILDQLLFEGVRSLELDIHSHSVPHMFNVYHTDKQSNSLCAPLDECLKQLLLFQHVLPEHDPVTVALELKEITGSPFDADHTIQDLDATIEKYLGPHLYRPRDLMVGCSNVGTIRDCLKLAGWPTLDAMRGKFVFALIGNWNGGINGCNVIVSHNRRAWVEYGTTAPGASARTAFLMESPWINAETPCQEGIGVRVVENAIKNSAFMQFEGGADGLFFPDQQNARAENRIVRADVGQNNQPKLSDQQATVAAGLSLIQNDYPWYAFNDATPLRPGIPIHPEKIPSGTTINEPGHRLLFLAKGGGANIALPISLGGAPSTRWESLVSNTRPTTDSTSPNPHRPRGVGCIYARSADQRNGVRVCRTTADGHWNVSKPVGEDVIVTFETTLNGSTSTSTYYSSNWDTGSKGGELLRLDVSQTPSRACVQTFSTELVVNDEPQWQALQNAACFNAPLTDQGLAAHDGDVLFVGAKMSQDTGPSAPASATTYLDPNNVSGESYDVQNLSWPRFPPNH